MGFTSETIAAMDRDAGPEMAVLMAASRPPDPGRGAGTAAAGAGQGGGATPPSQRTPGPAEPAAAGRAAPVDPDRLFELARLNKMLGVLPLAPAALPHPYCPDLRPHQRAPCSPVAPFATASILTSGFTQ